MSRKDWASSLVQLMARKSKPMKAQIFTKGPPMGSGGAGALFEVFRVNLTKTKAPLSKIHIFDSCSYFLEERGLHVDLRSFVPPWVTSASQEVEVSMFLMFVT